MLKRPGISKTETFHNTDVVGINLVGIPKLGDIHLKTPSFFLVIASQRPRNTSSYNGKSLSIEHKGEKLRFFSSTFVGKNGRTISRKKPSYIYDDFIVIGKQHPKQTF